MSLLKSIGECVLAAIGIVICGILILNVGLMLYSKIKFGKWFIRR